MLTFLLLLVGLPIAAGVVTYSAGSWLGCWAAICCFAFSLGPVGFVFYVFWKGTRWDGGIGLVFALFVSASSLLGLWLARPRALDTETGPGLTREVKEPVSSAPRGSS